MFNLGQGGPAWAWGPGVVMLRRSALPTRVRQSRETRRIGRVGDARLPPHGPFAFAGYGRLRPGRGRSRKMSSEMYVLENDPALHVPSDRACAAHPAQHDHTVSWFRLLREGRGIADSAVMRAEMFPQSWIVQSALSPFALWVIGGFIKCFFGLCMGGVVEVSNGSRQWTG